MSIHRISRILLLALFGLSHPSMSDNYAGKVFSNEGEKTQLFSFTRTYTQQGSNTLGIGEYKEMSGKLAVREETLLNGSTVISHSVIQNQQDESGKIVVEGNKVLFSYTREKKEEKSDEKLGKTLVVSASLVPFIQEHWDAIMAGEVNIRYASIDRSETIGFDLFKTDDDRAAPGNVAVKMKPSSFIIAAIVNPLFLHFDAKTKVLKEIYGRTAPKILDGKKWKDLDAHTVYEVTQ